MPGRSWRWWEQLRSTQLQNEDKQVRRLTWSFTSTSQEANIFQEGLQWEWINMLTLVSEAHLELTKITLVLFAWKPYIIQSNRNHCNYSNIVLIQIWSIVSSHPYSIHLSWSAMWLTSDYVICWSECSSTSASPTCHVKLKYLIMLMKNI